MARMDSIAPSRSQRYQDRRGVQKLLNLLIRMPVPVWNLLPDNRAYSLVGYVTSENLAKRLDQESPPLLDEALDETHSDKDDDTSSPVDSLFGTESNVTPTRIAPDITISESETVDISFRHATESRPLGSLDQRASSLTPSLNYGPPTSQFATAVARAYACLTMGMRIANVTQSFAGALSIDTASLFEQTLYQIVRPQDRDKVLRLQRSFEEELRQRVPQSLPTIYLEKFTGDGIIELIEPRQSLGSELHFNVKENIMFRVGSNIEHKSFHVRAALARENSTCFIVIWLVAPHSTTRAPGQQPAGHKSDRIDIGDLLE